MPRVSLLIYCKFCEFAFHFNARKLKNRFFEQRMNTVNFCRSDLPDNLERKSDLVNHS